MDASNALKYSSSVVRITVGLLFVMSAASKLIAIDSLELYIYSFEIFSYSATTILSRLLIATEFFIGMCLIFKLYYKKIWWLTVILMILFTIFLVYVIRFRNDDNCHCFGDLIPIDPKQSLVKNIIVTSLMLFIKKIDDSNYSLKIKKLLSGIIVALSVAIPFVIVPNDLIYNKIYSEKENIDTIAFYESLNDSTYIGYLKVLPEKLGDTIAYVDEDMMMDVGEGRHLINYVLAGCKYCRMGAERLAIMSRRYDIDKGKVKFVVGGNPEMMSRFVTSTETYDFGHWKISQFKLMDVTLGRFPLYVFVEDGKVVKAVDFRHLDEEAAVRFLTGK